MTLWLKRRLIETFHAIESEQILKDDRDHVI